MRKIIRLSESDLQKIIKKVIQEQNKTKYNFTAPVITQTKDAFSSSGGMMTKQKQLQDAAIIKSKYPCVPEKLQPFILYLMSNLSKIEKILGLNKATILFLAKYALGIIGRESQYGEYNPNTDSASETMRSIGLGLLPDAIIGTRNLFYKTKKSQSLGYAQFTPDAWESYGLDKSIGSYNDSFNAISQGLGALYRLVADYKLALKIGLKQEPSVNPMVKKYMGDGNNIKGTGNNALDFAIVAHNMGNDKIKRYCTTSHELYAAPCDSSTYPPFKKEESFNQYKKTGNFINSPTIPEKLKKFPGVLKVNQGSPILNYFPNLAAANHTAFGYVNDVAKNSEKFNCF